MHVDMKDRSIETEGESSMKYPEVAGKTVESVQATAPTDEGAFVDIRFTDKTSLWITFTTAKLTIKDASLVETSTGNYEIVKKYDPVQP